MASCADILRSEFPELDGEVFAYVTGEGGPRAVPVRCGVEAGRRGGGRHSAGRVAIVPSHVAT